MFDGKDILCGSLEEHEIEQLIFEYEEVSEETHGSGRWQEYVTTVIRYDDGNLYSIYWERGLTENQPNSFYNQPERVYAVPYIEVYQGNHYVTDKDAVSPALVRKEDVDAAKILVDNAEEAIETIKNFDIDSVLNFLESAETVLLSNKQTNFIAASKKLFGELKELQGEL